MPEQLPKVAERLFALLCSEAGVICNRSSDEDEAGWDYVVHFPPDPNDARPKDEQAGAETAFVQVKSTADAPATVQLKVSNALRMAKEPHPYFVVLVVGLGSGRRILARHFWISEIEASLRRVRSAELSGYGDRLHRRKMTFHLTDADDHSHDLLSWMRSTIDGVRGDYRAAKAAVVNSVGYAEGHTRLTVTIAASPDEIVDWELGLRPTPTVSAIAITRERFGIELPDPRFSGAGFEISIEPQGQPCLMVLRPRGGEAAVTLAGKLYPSNVLSNTPEKRAWRLDLDCLDLIWRSGKLTGSINLDFDRRVPLQTLSHHLVLAGLSGRGAARATLVTAGEKIELGALDLPERQDDVGSWRELASYVTSLRTVADADPAIEPSVSIADLLRAGGWLKRFHELFSSASMSIQHPPSEDDDPTHAILYRLRCDIGNWAFVAIVSREVPVDTIKDGLRTLYIKPAELLEAHILAGSWTEHGERIAVAHARNVEAMGDPTYFWDLGDMEEWLAKITAKHNGEPAAPEAEQAPPTLPRVNRARPVIK